MALKEWKRTELGLVIRLPLDGGIKRSLEIRVGIAAGHCYGRIRRDTRNWKERTIGIDSFIRKKSVGPRFLWKLLENTIGKGFYVFRFIVVNCAIQRKFRFLPSMSPSSCCVTHVGRISYADCKYLQCSCLMPVYSEIAQCNIVWRSSFLMNPKSLSISIINL